MHKGFFGSVATLIFALTITGCASTSREDSGEFDRSAEVEQILEGFETTGLNTPDERVRVAVGADQVLNVINDIAVNQRNNVLEYQAQRENFLDVMAVAEASGDEVGSDAFFAEVTRFDNENPDNPIMPKVIEYTEAQQGVYASNVRLAAQIASSSVELASLLQANAQDVAKAAAAGGIGSLMGGSTDPNENLGAALVRARDQLKYTQQARDLIGIEKETIEANLARQAELENQ